MFNRLKSLSLSNGLNQLTFLLIALGYGVASFSITSHAEHLKLPGGFSVQDLKQSKIYLEELKASNNQKYLFSTVKRDGRPSERPSTFIGVYNIKDMSLIRETELASRVVTASLHDSGKFLVTFEVKNKRGAPAKVIEYDLSDALKPKVKWELQIDYSEWDMDDQVTYIDKDYVLYSTQGQIRVIDRQTGDIKNAFSRGEIGGRYVNNYAFDPDRSLVFFSQSKQPSTIIAYNFLNGKKLGTLQLPQEIVGIAGLQMKVCPDGKKLFFRNVNPRGRSSKDVLFYLDHKNLAKSRAVIMDYSQFEASTYDEYASGESSFAPDGQTFAAAMIDHKAFVVWDLTSPQITANYYEVEFEGPSRFGVRFLLQQSPASTLLITEYAEYFWIEIPH